VQAQSVEEALEHVHGKQHAEGHHREDEVALRGKVRVGGSVGKNRSEREKR